MSKELDEDDLKKYPSYVSIDEGAKFSALLLKLFMHVRKETSDTDVIYYLVKGLEMIHHELYKEYVKESESDPDSYEGKHYEKKYQCGKLSQAIEALEIE